MFLTFVSFLIIGRKRRVEKREAKKEGEWGGRREEAGRRKEEGGRVEGKGWEGRGCLVNKWVGNIR